MVSGVPIVKHNSVCLSEQIFSVLQESQLDIKSMIKTNAVAKNQVLRIDFII